MCSILKTLGVFDRFWFWTIQYAQAYNSIYSPGPEIPRMLESVGKQCKAAPGLWGLAVLGGLLLFCKNSLRRWRFFIVGFFLFSVLAVCPGWYFREHYFIQVLPAAGLLAAVAFDTASGFFARHNSSFLRTSLPLIFAAAVASTLIQWRNIYFFLTPAQACHAIYGGNPFPEAVEISRYLESHCAPDARILVLGSEPEIYFYSHRHSATGYIYLYPLMEQQPYAAAMQREMIQEAERANPEYVVCVNISASWLENVNCTNTVIIDWFDKYQQEHLQLVGMTEILPDNQAEYHWFGPQEPFIQPRSSGWLTIYKSRSAVENKPPNSR
jgi:hypothetical protein